MCYLALATDYDDTLAADGEVRKETFAALSLLRKSGRRTILVTGRALPDLKRACRRLDLFDRVVAENGALLYRPHSGEEVVLNKKVVLNKGAVMPLPPGVDKRSGLSAALDELGLSLRNTVAVGDAENDQAMLAASQCGVAVANALGSLKDGADLVLREPRGQGVEELIARLIEDDLRSVLVARHALLLGVRRDGTGLRVLPNARVLIAGPSGKATAATRFLARVVAAGYQCCMVVDDRRVEGVAVGAKDRPPHLEEVMELLRQPGRHAAVCLTSVPLQDRTAFLAALLPRLQEVRARLGRPHWIVIDEAHQFFPDSQEPVALTLPRDLGGILLLTAHPERLSPAVLQAVDTVLAAGDRPEQTLRPFGAGRPARLFEGEVLSWSNGQIEPLRLGTGEAP